MIAFVAWAQASGWPVVRTDDVEDWTGELGSHELLGHDAEDITDPYFRATRRFLLIYAGF